MTKMQVIVYRRPDDNGISVVTPEAEALTMFGIDLIAAKDVPDGTPYKIVDLSEVPAKEAREGWMTRKNDFTDGIGKGQYITAPQ